MAEENKEKKKRRGRRRRHKPAEPSPPPPPKFYDTDRAQSSLPKVGLALAGAFTGSVMQELAVDKFDVEPMHASIVTTVGGGAGALGTEGNAQAFCAGVAASGVAHGYAAMQDERRKKKEKKRKEEEEKKRREEEEKRKREEEPGIADAARGADLSASDDVMSRHALAAARAEYEAAQNAAHALAAPSPPALPPATVPRGADLGAYASGYGALPVHLRPVADAAPTPRGADLSGANANGYGHLPVHLRPVASG